MSGQPESTPSESPIGSGDLASTPLGAPRKFVSCPEFAVLSRSAPDVALEAFRADQDTLVNQESDDFHLPRDKA
ncbi:hypothetical protein GCM10009554_55680 [Kribbella koreensis]|uniref:DUF397 domain-containing protein n=1 Tax=Kribbella koreensis TaxID=57909 RepID=A0ABN1R727_9ACTN